MPDAPTPGEHVKAWLFKVLPHHLISRVVFWLTRVRSPLTHHAIRAFAHRFNVDMSEAAEPDPRTYATFNDFFVRKLRPDARTIDGDPRALLCPADGRISQIGDLNGDDVVQAKGQSFSARTLLGGEPGRSAPFEGGKFCTIYLSPRDYHRVHMPRAGTLTGMVHVPGRLFTVAPFATRTIPGLFARNERVAALFETDSGPMAVVLVGAINVAAIETTWAGLVTPPMGKKIQVTDYPASEESPRIGRGEEMGRFNMGSTVILLFPPGTVTWDERLSEESPSRVGRRIGQIL
ncbi:MAG: archaetidylserine decarboxylase [Pseudomonadota bacterium]|nr:archaetidylserine decarboxylase [Pseudomonadota bacterium]